MSNVLISEKEFGELIGQFKALTKDLNKLEGQVTVLDVKVDSILSRFDQMGGAWKTLMWVGGVVGVIASVMTTIAIKSWPLLLGTLPKV